MCTIVTPAPSIVPATPAACPTSSAPGCAAATSTPPAAPLGRSRAELLTPQTWADQRETLCDDLALEPEPDTVIGQLPAALDAAWRGTAAGCAASPDLRIEHRKGRDEIVLTPLDADPEPASLVTLRGEVERLLPEVEIADLPLEVHGWTGFLDEYPHMAGARVEDEVSGNMAGSMHRVEQFLDVLVAAFDDLRDIADNRLSPLELRERSMLGSVTMLRVLAAVYHDLTKSDPSSGQRAWSRADVEDFFRRLTPHLRRIPVTRRDRFWLDIEAFVPGGTAPIARQGSTKKLVSAMAGWARNGLPDTQP